MKKLLCLTVYPIEGGSDRYRVCQFLPYLERGGYHTTVRPFATTWLFRAMQTRGRMPKKMLHAAFCAARRFLDLLSLNRYDLVMINREAFPFFTPWVERAVLWRQSRVVFNFDDAIYVGHKDTADLPHPLLHRLKHSAGVSEVVRRSAHVIAGCETLAAYARQYNTSVSVIPTVVDLDQYTYVPRRAQEAAPITIGWWGSRSTSPYLAAVHGALRRLHAVHQGRVKFVFWGDSEYRTDLPSARVIPFSLQAEVEELGKVDIGIMPMPDTPWTRGKCAFKAIQYMARGIPTVVSPVGMSADVVQHGFNGFWAHNEEEWFLYLDELVKSEELRRRFSAAGRETVEQKYSLQIWGPRLPALFDEILAEPTRVAQQMCVEG